MRRLALPFSLVSGLLPLILAGCSPAYSPNTYASSAAQMEAAVQRGVIIGVRQVLISANGTIFAAAGGAAGGVTGAQVAGGGVVTALSAIGGTLAGGIGGTVAAQKVADTKGWEYIVQEEPGDKLVSVTQTSKTAIPIGTNVLVIAGTQQARIVPDYTVPAAAAPAKTTVASAAKATAAPDGSTAMEIDIGPVPPASGLAAPLQVAPITVASDPTTPPAPSIATAPPPASAPSPALTPQAENNKNSASALAAGSTAVSALAAPEPITTQAASSTAPP